MLFTESEVSIPQQHTLITAHSGPDGTPDNTEGNVLYALQTQADALELDVRRDAKDKLILSHDVHGAESPVLSLDEAFDLISKHPSMRINCDLKEAGLEQAIYDLAKTYGLETRLIYSGAANPERCRHLPISLFLNLEFFLEAEAYSGQWTEQADSSEPRVLRQRLLEFIDKLPELGAEKLNLYYKVFDRAFVDENEEDVSHLPISLWTVDDEVRLEHYLKLGVSALTTRRVSLATRLRREIEKSQQQAEKGRPCV